ncbi:MAG TPA: hypothetical protein VH643_24940 [Gemmataceae bacterium]
MKRRPASGLVLLSLGGLVLVPPLRAGFPRPQPPLPQRVVLADRVVVGKVTKVVPDPVHALALPKIPGAPRVRYQLAVLHVETTLVGARGPREIRIGFVPPPSSRRPADFQWTVGQEGCFFLRSHPDESFLVVQDSGDVMDRARTKEFDRDLALVKRCAKLLADPAAGLRAKDAEDRLLTAAMLIFRYRTPQYIYRGAPKTEPIDAEENRLILSILAESPWTEADVRAPTGRLRLFLRMGLTDKDGWKSPDSTKEAASAAREWLASNAKEYRIRRYVPE